jgi:hypothetical protein
VAKSILHDLPQVSGLEEPVEEQDDFSLAEVVAADHPVARQVDVADAPELVSHGTVGAPGGEKVALQSRLPFGVSPFVLLLACNGDPEDTDVIPAGGGSSEECGENPPEIETFAISDEGMSTGDECGDTSRPMIRLAADATDADGDLHYWTLRVWYDDVVDDTIDTSADCAEVFGTAGEDCDVPAVNVAMLLCVTGDPPFETEMEFGAVLFDDRDNPSSGGEPVIEVFTTPDASGND